MQTTREIRPIIDDAATVTLAPSTIIEPHVSHWCAWSFLLPPVPASLYFTRYQLPLLDSFIQQPESHAKAAIDPQLSLLPQIEANGLMHMTGLFPSVPQQVNFELAFAPVNGQWRLFGISVTVGQAAPAAPDPPTQKPPPAPAKPPAPAAAAPPPAKKPVAHSTAQEPPPKQQ